VGTADHVQRFFVDTEDGIVREETFFQCDGFDNFVIGGIQDSNFVSIAVHDIDGAPVAGGTKGTGTFVLLGSKTLKRDKHCNEH
jgi:hypothetical protein